MIIAQLPEGGTSGTWVPVITPDPAAQPHTIADLQIPAFFQKIGNIVSISLRYTINTANTGGVTTTWRDFITLPFPPLLPFPTVLEAAGTADVAPFMLTDLENGAAVSSVMGDTRIQVRYLFLSAGGNFASVSVTAMYTIA
jgi:hypothetical protein